MIRISELKLPLTALPVETRRAADAPTETDEDRLPPPHPIAELRRLAAQALGIADSEIAELQVFKRSFDARKVELLAVFICDLTLAEPTQEAALLAKFEQNPHINRTPDMSWHAPAHAPAGWPTDLAERPVVVGFGPCGIFAALALAQMGLKPIVLERGRPVRQRTKDTWGLWRKKVLTPESNVQYGEGGAGLFSDGKLYSQIKDPRFLGRKVMREFVAAGAPPEILYMAHPHIGTFKLVKVVEAMRDQIIELGGEIRFEQRVAELLLEPATGGDAPAGFQPQRVRGLKVQDLASGELHELAARHVVLALGHSSRDTFAMLHDAGVFLEPKPFSIGVRIEHPQSVIDQSLWGRHAGHPLLGAAAYKLVHHADNGRAVYSFCMCPGGTVVAATSEPNRVVTNGMSQYSRAERNANAGMVVGIEPGDYPLDAEAWIAAFDAADGARYAAQAQALHAQGKIHPLAGVVFQRQLESRAFEAGGRDYQAPGQRVGDFLAGQPSDHLGEVQPSYKPGIKLGDLAQVLPDYAVTAMREALPVFGRKIKGYDMADAVMTGVETRTSSPLRITRGEDFQSLNVEGLYPAGEGAGYAGGILSAGVDGIKVAEAVAVATVGSR
ncbi:NAD(P)/FAD-dependent oxidoreductase [Malikia sp.]|uniref:NAD(P)/FAD-dependent oxidoreductase n=1 Tax=Malikia sp. TaxID=2070706 RepID=UPI0026304E4B|nr:FAD-dependent oxidoreductase [Malikia sp.]MDD2730430.1 FAD-dependent oxidoreductase [Malikia sp.]